MNHPAPISFFAFVAALPLVATLNAQTSIPAGTGNYTTPAPGSYILNAGDARTSASGETISITGASGDYTLQIDGSVFQTGTTDAAWAIRTGNSTGRNYYITVGSTGRVESANTAEAAIHARRATTLTNSGVLLSTGLRVLDTRNQDDGGVTVHNLEGGLIQSQVNDALRVRGQTVTLTNAGTIYSGSNLAGNPSGPLDLGQALDFTDATGGSVINYATGLLRSDGHDAVRLGSNMTFTNHGTVLGNGVVNDSASNVVFNPGWSSDHPDWNEGVPNERYSASDGVSFEGGSNSSLVNHGTISGARHGVEAAEAAKNITVTNVAGGQIIGRNGSGVGFDTLETDATKIVVNNHGLIRGDYAGVGNIIDRTGNASLHNDGDGDGIDIDGAATINNFETGEIISTGAGGYDSNGRANNSEAISIGGGVIVNDGLIQGANRGILVNNDSVASRGGYVATSITNNATGVIEGQDGFAIRLENKYGDARDNDTIVNHGTIIGTGAIPDPDAIVLRQDGLADPHSIGTLDGVVYDGEGLARFIRGDGSAIQMGEGDDVLTNHGTITGTNGRAINMEGGNDTVNFNAGAITGDIDGGTGTDTLNLGNGVSTASAVKNFEQANVAAGSATLSGVVSGTTFNKGGAGTLVLSGANTLTGLVTIEEGMFVVNNTTGSATGSGDVVVNTGAILAGDGIIAGNVTIDGILAPGNSIGVLTVQGDVTWTGEAGNAWQFELGLGNLSDRLLIGGDFLKGLGEDYVFDFLGGGVNGEFVLVEWTGTTDFTAEDFGFVNLGSGFSGEFSIDGNQLVFSAVPEPAAAGALLGLGALGFAMLRRRRTR